MASTLISGSQYLHIPYRTTQAGINLVLKMFPSYRQTLQNRGAPAHDALGSSHAASYDNPHNRVYNRIHICPLSNTGKDRLSRFAPPKLHADYLVVRFPTGHRYHGGMDNHDPTTIRYIVLESFFGLGPDFTST